MRSILRVALILLMMPGSIHAAATPQELALTAIKALPPHQNWDRVETFRSVGPMSFEIIIYYKEDPEGDEEVKADTRAVADAILQLFVAEGRDPRKEAVTVNVHGFRKITRPSGKSLVVDYGFSYYDYTADQLVYRAGPYSPLYPHR